jgi:hypothetical protein
VVNVFMSSRERYVKAMLKAIDEARRCGWYGGVTESKTDGLRVIRRFEKVNSINFDPFDSAHIDMVSGCAEYENFFRKARQ